MSSIDLGYDFDAHIVAFRRRRPRKKSKWTHVPGSYRKTSAIIEVEK